eukprot:4308501-Alexandrium_andersonii.AAC.1
MEASICSSVYGARAQASGHHHQGRPAGARGHRKGRSCRAGHKCLDEAKRLRATQGIVEPSGLIGAMADGSG